MTQDLKTKIAEAMNVELTIPPYPVLGLTTRLTKAALQAIHDAGFAVVPREPTEAMFEAGFDATSVELHPGEHPDDVNNPAVCWRAMLSASQPKTEEG